MRKEISFDLDQDVFDRLLVLSEQAGIPMREYVRRRLRVIVTRDKEKKGDENNG